MRSWQIGKPFCVPLTVLDVYTKSYTHTVVSREALIVKFQIDAKIAISPITDSNVFLLVCFVFAVNYSLY